MQLAHTLRPTFLTTNKFLDHTKFATFSLLYIFWPTKWGKTHLRSFFFVSSSSSSHILLLPSSLSLKIPSWELKLKLGTSRFLKNQDKGSKWIKLGGGLKAIPQGLELSPLWISQALALSLGVLELPRTQGKEIHAILLFENYS